MLDIDETQSANPELYKAYLITIIKNNIRSLTKACALLIKNKDNMSLNDTESNQLKALLESHVNNEHDLETIWLLYLLIEVERITANDSLIQIIVDDENELAQIILLRKQLLSNSNLELICGKAKSWILLYELYIGNFIDEDAFISKLNLSKNVDFYRNLKRRNLHLVC